MPRLGTKGGSVKNNLQMPREGPRRIEVFDDIGVQSLQIGLRHSAVIDSQGSLWTFGNGNWGVLGHGTEKDIRFDQPKKITSLEKQGVQIKDVAMGEYHTLALDTEGNVWTWGYGGKKGYFNWMYTQEVGALGHGDLEPNFAPKKVKFFEENGLKVKAIAAGNYHCVALCDDEKMYNWGRGLYGVLGNGSNSYSMLPSVNSEFEYIFQEAKDNQQEIGFSKVQAADDYTGCLLTDGSYYVWGKNDRGQMGVGSGIGIDLVESENVPVEVDINQALPAGADTTHNYVSDFCTGMNSMLVRDTLGRIYKCGLKIDYNPKLVNFDGQRLKGHSVVKMSCGTNHYAVLDQSENNLHTFGRIIKEKADEEYDGFGIYDCDTLFEQGKVEEIEMRYEIFGALVKH